MVLKTLEVTDKNYLAIKIRKENFFTLPRKADASQGDVGLGKFFATGAVAKSLADGFSCKLAGSKSAEYGFSEPVVEDEAEVEE